MRAPGFPTFGLALVLSASLVTFAHAAADSDPCDSVINTNEELTCRVYTRSLSACTDACYPYRSNGVWHYPTVEPPDRNWFIEGSKPPPGSPRPYDQAHAAADYSDPCASVVGTSKERTCRIIGYPPSGPVRGNVSSSPWLTELCSHGNFAPPVPMEADGTITILDCNRGMFTRFAPEDQR